MKKLNMDLAYITEKTTYADTYIVDSSKCNESIDI